MVGQPNVLTALVLVGLFAAILLGLLSYHSPRRSYVDAGLGVLIVAASVALLLSSLGQPNAMTAVVLFLVFFALMSVLLIYQSRGWAHVAWWVGVLLFLLALPFLAAGRGDLAVFSFIAGPGLLMLVASLTPEVPARYARLGVTDAPPELTQEELSYERRRYTRLAGGLTVVAVLGVFLFGVPQAPVSEVQAVGPVVFDQQLADRGAQLFTDFGCVTCHSVNGQSGVGPTLQGAAHRTRRLTDGTVQAPTDEYILQSIRDPNAKVVQGFSSGVMLAGISPRLAEITQPDNLNALLNYIKSIAPA
ncbi:MAG TPA: cytochrome c [Chloroflexota bacterium]|nr:cytochrome c [Chloroflexota bacterium]